MPLQRMKQNKKEKQGVFTRKIRITRKECDEKEKLSIRQLARILELTAAEHLRLYGLGADGLYEKGALWVLVKREIYIRRLPICGEKTVLHTWTGAERNWLYPKYFRMEAESGRVLLEASCLWAMMNRDSRTIMQPAPKAECMPAVKLEGQMELPSWTVSFPALTKQKMRTVREKETDYNGHLNNSWYLQWAEELLNPESPDTKVLKKIWIEYSRELLEGQEVLLKYQQEDTTLYVKGYYRDENVFSAKLEYEIV